MNDPSESPAYEGWEQHLGSIIQRLREVYEKRFSSIKEFSEFLRAENIEPSSPRTMHDYLAPDTEKSKPDLEWLLKVADALGLDYVELFKGARTGWDRAPGERYRVHLPNDMGEIEFRVPAGWPREKLDLSISNLPLDRDMNVRVEKVGHSEANEEGAA